MSLNIQSYRTLVFDCDGVVLNSNKVKTDAFYRSSMSYGEEAARALVEYHLAHGGVSRYKKFIFFLESIIGSYSQLELDRLLLDYASNVRSGLLTCDIAPSLGKLRELTSDSKWLIVSGGDQDELRNIFAERKLASLFDGGIFGSPDTKELILSRETDNGNITMPAIFLGDSKYDYKASQLAGLDFIFLTDWSEVKDCKSWIAENSLRTSPSIATIAGSINV